jgi:hypothetical protein
MRITFEATSLTIHTHNRVRQGPEAGSIGSLTYPPTLTPDLTPISSLSKTNLDTNNPPSPSHLRELYPRHKDLRRSLLCVPPGPGHAVYPRQSRAAGRRFYP